MKIYDPSKRTKFSVRQMHNVSQKFHSVAALRSALWHEFGDAVPDEGEFNVGYFEGKQHTKKWLVTSQDLKAMYSYFQGKPCLSLWCDGSKDQQEDDHEETAPRKKTKKETKKETKRHEREDELEDVFQQLKKRHGSEYSGPQLRLWARMYVANTHDDLDHPPNVPIITGSVQRPRRESLSDAFSNAATAFAKAFSPQPTASPSTSCSPTKVVDIRMKNLEQLRCLQQLREDGILTEEEFCVQKSIVLKSLNKLV